MGFLGNEDYDDLPADDADAFVKLEAISRSRLHDGPRDRDGDIPYEDALRYMNEIAALADEFRIPDISYDPEPNSFSVEFARFTRAVDFRVAQIRVQRARRTQRHSVAISGPAREKIQHYLERLKEEVRAADIPEKRRAALLDKIAEFEAELVKPRFNLALAMAVILGVNSVVHDNVDNLINAPKLLEAITVIIGKAKAGEEDAAPPLPKPAVFRQIPDMRGQQLTTKVQVSLGDDDDMPF